jgi:hypothetical protein
MDDLKKDDKVYDKELDEVGKVIWVEDDEYLPKILVRFDRLNEKTMINGNEVWYSVYRIYNSYGQRWGGGPRERFLYHSREEAYPPAEPKSYDDLVIDMRKRIRGTMADASRVELIYEAGAHYLRVGFPVANDKWFFDVCRAAEKFVEDWKPYHFYPVTHQFATDSGNFLSINVDDYIK